MSETELTEETLEMMFRVVEHVKNIREQGFSVMGATDPRSFLTGLLCGCAVGMGLPFPIISLILDHPAIDAMIEGACGDD